VTGGVCEQSEELTYGGGKVDQDIRHTVVVGEKARGPIPTSGGAIRRSDTYLLQSWVKDHEKVE